MLLVSMKLRPLVAVVAIAAGLLASSTPAEAARPAPDVRHVTVIVSAHDWPGIRAVVDGWRRSRYIDARIANTCRPHNYCVWVESDDYGAAWQGQTTNVGPRSAWIQLNRSTPSDEREGVFCHEMGHALGIAHPAPDAALGVWGCIAGTSGTTPTPSRADVAQLAAIAYGQPQGTPQRWGAMWVAQ